MKNAYITGEGRGIISKVLPDSNPTVDCKVLLLQLRGIKDVHFNFCLGSEKTPWTRAKRWLCFLMCFTVATLIFTFYNSSTEVSWPLNFWKTSSVSSQSYNNLTTAVGSVSIFTGLCIHVLSQRQLSKWPIQIKIHTHNATLLFFPFHPIIRTVIH